MTVPLVAISLIGVYDTIFFAALAILSILDTRSSRRRIESKDSVGTDPEPSSQQVWELFHKTRNRCYRNLLMEHYRYLVRHWAERLQSRLSDEFDEFELDYLMSVGIIGMVEAIERFDPSGGVDFEVYCAARIEEAILDEIRSMEWVPNLAALNTDYIDGYGEGDIREINIIIDLRSRNTFIETHNRDIRNLLTEDPQLQKQVSKPLNRSKQRQSKTLKRMAAALVYSPIRACWQVAMVSPVISMPVMVLLMMFIMLSGLIFYSAIFS